MIPVEKQAAQMLVGRTLPDGWEVIEKLKRDPSHTGGVYSSCYLVKNGTRRGFLKAFDYSGALKVGEDSAQLLKNILNAYTLERDILSSCKENRCKNIIRLLDTGNIEIEDAAQYPRVEYLILEFAEKGDIRNTLSEKQLTLKIQLRSLHQLANGLRQIHKLKYAHQDIKPSNIVRCGDGITKITDFGSAVPVYSEVMSLPRHLQMPIPGSWAYAPPELLYGDLNVNSAIRRIGCDLYLLGSMVAFYFTNMNMTALIKNNLADSVSWENPETYGKYPEVKSYVNAAFQLALGDIAQQINDNEIKDQVLLVVRFLCNPDPAKRGHEKTISQLGSNYDLERFVTIFDVIASKYERL